VSVLFYLLSRFSQVPFSLCFPSNPKTLYKPTVRALAIIFHICQSGFFHYYIITTYITIAIHYYVLLCIINRFIITKQSTLHLVWLTFTQNPPVKISVVVPDQEERRFILSLLFSSSSSRDFL